MITATQTINFATLRVWLASTVVRKIQNFLNIFNASLNSMHNGVKTLDKKMAGKA
jgi:hypothetical protein